MLQRPLKGSLSVPQAPRRDAPVRCEFCDREVARASRRQRFCSKRCRQQAHYEKLVAEGRFDPILDRDSALPTNPHKKLNGLNALQAAKSGSNPRIYGPRRVIEAELFRGGNWSSITSPDGVTVSVTRLWGRP